jgi:phosphoglycerate dehydrogenase-like enzyme
VCGGRVVPATLAEAIGKHEIVGPDVFAVEPLPADHPFRSLPTVLATPHLGYVSRRTYDIFFRHAVEDIAAFLAGAPVRRIA